MILLSASCNEGFFMTTQFLMLFKDETDRIAVLRDLTGMKWSEVVKNATMAVWARILSPLANGTIFSRLQWADFSQSSDFWGELQGKTSTSTQFEDQSVVKVLEVVKSSTRALWVPTASPLSSGTTFVRLQWAIFKWQTDFWGELQGNPNQHPVSKISLLWSV